MEKRTRWPNGRRVLRIDRQRLPADAAVGKGYFMLRSYSSIIFLTIWPPMEPASREVRLPL